MRELAQAAGLRVRKQDNLSWMSVGDLRAALLEHLAPERSAAAEEFPGCVFVLCVSCFLMM